MFTLTTKDLQNSQLQTISEICESEVDVHTDNELIDEGIGTYSESGSEYAEHTSNEITLCVSVNGDVSQYSTSFHTRIDGQNMGHTNLSFIHSNDSLISEQGDQNSDTHRESDDVTCKCHSSHLGTHELSVIACTKM